MDKVKGKSRRDKARATRSAIIQAASEEFVEKGFHGSTIASIAARAGVATQTVYFVFHTKAELMSATIDAAVMTEDEPVIPQEATWWKAMEAEANAADALMIFIRGAAPAFERASALSEVLRGAALTDPEVRQLHEFHESLRREAFEQAIDTLTAKGTLRQGLTIDTATDVLMTVFGDSTYQLMTANHGWSHQQTVDWLCEVLPELLLQTPQD
jgi:AcrR family transcriptional regulator